MKFVTFPDCFIFLVHEFALLNSHWLGTTVSLPLGPVATRARRDPLVGFERRPPRALARGNPDGEHGNGELRSRYWARRHGRTRTLGYDHRTAVLRGVVAGERLGNNGGTVATSKTDRVVDTDRDREGKRVRAVR